MESEEATLRRQARQREYYLKHREKLLAYSRKYIKEHPEKQKLYRENAAKKRANGKGYYQDHQSQFPDGARANSLGGQWSSSHSYSNGGKTLQASKGLERTGRKRDVQPKERSTSPEWTDRLSRLQQSGRWRNFPTQSPVCRGNDGIPFDVDSLTISFPKWRQESIKAYGNAWVPQVAYEIFRAIEAEENK